MNHVEYVWYLDHMTKANDLIIRENTLLVYFDMIWNLTNDVPDFLLIHGMDKAPHHYPSSQDTPHLVEFHRLCLTSNTIL